jgi:hypothetical protein
LGVLRELAVTHPMMGLAVIVLALMVACFAARVAWESFETDADGAVSSAALAIGIAMWLGFALLGSPKVSSPADPAVYSTFR